MASREFERVRRERAKAQLQWDKLYSKPGLATSRAEFIDMAHAEAFKQDADDLHRMFSYLLEDLNRELTYSQGKIAKFQEDLSKDAHYAFRWAHVALEAAARELVLKVTIKTMIENGLEAAREQANRELVHGARFPERSTAQVHNLLGQHTTQAWAETAEILRRWLA